VTTYIGPRPDEYDDHAAGTIRIEVDLEMWSNSDREKHRDITEQGGWIAEAIAQALANFPKGDDIRIHDLRYYGDVKPTAEVPVSTRETT
jgi:hypothetical protein